VGEKYRADTIKNSQTNLIVVLDHHAILIVTATPARWNIWKGQGDI